VPERPLLAAIGQSLPGPGRKVALRPLQSPLAAIGKALIDPLRLELLALGLALADIVATLDRACFTASNLTAFDLMAVALDAARLPLDRAIGPFEAALDGLPANLSIHSLSAFEALLALGPLDADLPLRPFHAHAALLPFNSNLALRPLDAHLLRPFRTLALRPLGSLTATALLLDMLGRSALAAPILRLRRRGRCQRQSGATGNPHHPGHD
jgi:hypothetical protein